MLCHGERGSSGLYDGLIWPNDGCASISWLQCRRSTFFPWAFPPHVASRAGAPVRPFLAQDKKVALWHPPLRFGPKTDAAPIASGLSIAIETAMVAARKQRARRTTMANIGTFTKNEAGAFTGEIVTLSFQAKNVRLVPETNRANENAPSHRAYVGRAEIGAAWPKRSAEQRDYLSVKLDDPSFNAPIYANLFDDEDGDSYTLIWSRPQKARTATAD